MLDHKELELNVTLTTKHELDNCGSIYSLQADGLCRPPNNGNGQAIDVLCPSEGWQSTCLIKFSCIKAEAQKQLPPRSKSSPNISIKSTK